MGSPPQEPIRIVIGNLSAKGNRATLKTCSLVSKSWGLPTRYPRLSLSFIRDLQIRVVDLDLHLVILVHILQQLPQLRSLHLIGPDSVHHLRPFALLSTPWPLSNVTVHRCSVVSWSTFSRFLQIFPRTGLLHLDSLSVQDPAGNADASLISITKINVHA